MIVHDQKLHARLSSLLLVIDCEEELLLVPYGQRHPVCGAILYPLCVRNPGPLMVEVMVFQSERTDLIEKVRQKFAIAAETVVRDEEGSLTILGYYSVPQDPEWMSVAILRADSEEPKDWRTIAFIEGEDFTTMEKV